jgi:putative Mg2+ transporter-C (MgtC) family protein
LFDHLYDFHFWIRIILAIVCGFTVGIERQLKGKPVGVRTSILICLGTMTFMRLGMHIGDDMIIGQTDPTRTLGQIITGVGFLGAGVIMNLRGTVIGVTSAAVVWLLAAIGCAIGIDRFDFAVVMAILSTSILVGVQFLETKTKLFRKEVHDESGIMKKNPQYEKEFL